MTPSVAAPAQIGDVYHDRYLVVKKLGWGHFSTVWLAKDMAFASKTGSGAEGVSGYHGSEYVALKIQKSASHYIDAAFDEIDLLSAVKKQVRFPETGSRKSDSFRVIALYNQRCLC